MQEPSNSDGGGTLSMVDVLEENEELEEEAKAVLGDSDDKCCTYATGYRERQALYACSTCITSEGTFAGICLACSYACHDGHELFELYTKRNFRCDCGNSKFADLTCKLISDKKPLNEENKYNQNYKGLYCSCKRPYPDPDDCVDDEMIQCVICEDWFHGRHLGIQELPPNYEYQEMVCTACLKQNDFLWAYALHSLDITEVKDESNVKHEVDVDSSSSSDKIQPDRKKEEGVPSSTAGAPSIKDAQEEDTKEGKPEAAETDSNHKVEKQSSSSESSETRSMSNVTSDSKDSRPKSSSEENENSNKTEPTKSVSSSLCQLEQLGNRTVQKPEGAIFWKSSWRSKLCTCQPCKEMYETLCVSFLVRDDDTVLSYEERGKLNESGLSQYEKGMQALSHLDRIQQVEVLHGYNDLKSELRNFLQSFAEEGKVVKTEDINRFFEEMQARKRQKTGPMQYFCR